MALCHCKVYLSNLSPYCIPYQWIYWERYGLYKSFKLTFQKRNLQHFVWLRIKMAIAIVYDNYCHCWNCCTAPWFWCRRIISIHYYYYLLLIDCPKYWEGQDYPFVQSRLFNQKWFSWFLRHAVYIRVSWEEYKKIFECMQVCLSLICPTFSVLSL